MFKRTDRVMVAVRDLDEATENYRAILSAVAIDEYENELLNSRIRVLQLGASQVELCAAMGDGKIASHLQAFGEGLYCGGVSVDDLQACRQVLTDQNIRVTDDGDRIYPEPQDMFGLALVISPEKPQPVEKYSGPVDFLYEITQVLKTKWQTVADHYSGKLGLDEKNFVGITFARFGYEGTLMKFSDDRLDRIELSEAHDAAYPMGRFVKKRGDALYMCYIETNDLAEIISRLEAHGHPWTRRTTTPVEEDGLWIHPKVLNGVLMGVSRRTLAWGWSGKPGWVQPLGKKETV